MSYPNFDSIDFNFQRNLVTFYDVPVAILFLILGVIFFNYVRKRSPNVFGARSSVFFSAFFLHTFSSIFITLVYSFYYEGGDTTAYFNDARLLHKIFWYDPQTALDIFFSSPKELLSNHPYIYRSFRFAAASDTFMVVRFAFIIQFFSSPLFLPTALFFGYISFYASWKFYLLLCSNYPHLAKLLVVAIFFIPGVHVWGSGVFKDTLSMVLLYLILITLYQFIKGLSARAVFKLLICIYLLFVIKIYILLTLFLGLFVFFVLHNTKRIRNIVLKALVFPLLIAIGVAGFFIAFTIIGENSKRGIYSMDQILNRAEIVAGYLDYVSQKSDGSTYNLEIGSFTPQVLARKIPAALNVTFFRPYLWEVKNPFMLAAAIESLAIFLFTLYVIVRVGVLKFLKKISASPLIFAILAYSFSFAFAIGITSSNFGTLMRYKIPIIPLYLIALILILYPKRTTSTNGF